MQRANQWLDILLRLAVLSAALIIPLVLCLGTSEAFELPKSIALKFFGIIAAGALVCRRQPLTIRSAWIPALFLGACLLSMIRTPLAEASLERLWELGAIVVLLWAAESGVVSRGKILFMVLLSFACVTLYSTAQYLGMDVIRWNSFGEKRVYSTMGNPDFLSAHASILLPLIVGMVFWTRNLGVRVLLVACFILALPAMVYTQARGASLSLLAAGLTLAWLSHRYIYRLSLGKFLKWGAAGAGACLVLLLAVPAGRQFISRFQELRHPVKAASIQNRLFYWYSGWIMGTGYQSLPNSPSLTITGTGIGTFHLAGAQAQGETFQIWSKRWPRAAEVANPHLELYAHNDYVQLFAEIGPIGLGAYVWIMVTLLAVGMAALKRSSLSSNRDQWLHVGLIAGMIAFAVNSLTNFPLKVISNSHALFSCLIPVLLYSSLLPLRTIQFPRHRMAVMCAVLLCFLGAERIFGKFTASHYLKYGTKLMENGGSQQAKWYFDNSLKLRPLHTEAILAHHYIGRTSLTNGNLEEAIDAFGRSLSTFTDFSEALKARGWTYLRLATAPEFLTRQISLTQLHAALADLKRACFLNPTDPQSWYGLGTAFRLLDRPQESIAPYENAIKYSQASYPEARYGLSLSHSQLTR